MTLYGLEIVEELNKETGYWIVSVPALPGCVMKGIDVDHLERWLYLIIVAIIDEMRTEYPKWYKELRDDAHTRNPSDSRRNL